MIDVDEPEIVIRGPPPVDPLEATRELQQYVPRAEAGDKVKDEVVQDDSDDKDRSAGGLEVYIPSDLRDQEPGTPEGSSGSDVFQDTIAGSPSPRTSLPREVKQRLPARPTSSGEGREPPGTTRHRTGLGI